ncbi:MAG: LptA/OstA family protein [Puniceicoccaceae bacterium]
MIRSVLPLLLAGALAALPLRAEPPPGEESERTVIESERLSVIHTEQGNRFIFSGNVRVTGSDFEAECDRMEVRTTAGRGEDDGFGAIEVVEATGNVRVLQGGREATAGKAFIYPAENRVVLEDGPAVRDGRGTVTGHRMILRGAEGRIEVEPGPEGNRPRVELPDLDAVRKSAEEEIPGDG